MPSHDVPSHEGTLAPSSEYDSTCAYTFCTSKSTTQRANRSVQPFLHRSRQCRYTLQQATPTPFKITYLVGDLDPSNKKFLGFIRAHSPTGILSCSDVFAQMTAEYPCTLKWDASSLPSQLPLPLRGSGPPSNTWFDGSTQVLNPNGISIGSAVFQGLLL